MKEIEEVNCEVRRVIDIQHLLSDRLNNVEEDDYRSSLNLHKYEGSHNSFGGFLHGATYAWMSYGCNLVIFCVKTGESISSWTFRETVVCVAEFPAQPGQLPLLLVGLDNCSHRIKDSVGFLCIFDCNTSRVLRAIQTPIGIEQVCIVTGGAEWEEFNDKRGNDALNETDGIACVVLRNLYHILIDLQRSEWSRPNSSIMMDETSPAEIDLAPIESSNLRNRFNKEKHAAYNLFCGRIEKHIGFDRSKFELSSLFEENLTTAIISSTKIGCIVSGCLGRIMIWQHDGSIEWISMPMEKNMVITHLALLEPTDDPRPFYYLWAVYQEESCKTPPILRMYALLFERKYCDKGSNLYFNLEVEPSLKFEFELEAGDKINSLSAIERETNQDQTDLSIKRGEANLLLVGTNNRILLFDLNQWYKEQMPRTVYDCQNPNSILASYRTKLDVQNVKNNQSICCNYVLLTLHEFPNNNCSPPEELFYPNSLSFEWVELSSTKLLFWMTRGIQAELLREMAIAGPIILLQPSEIFHKCLSIGLVPFNTEFSFINDQNAQREMLLSLCLEQRWATFLIKCAKEWLDGSASYLYSTFFKWGVQRASSIKMIADKLCVPLFDQSGISIGETEVKTLRFCSQQLECLSNVVAKLTLQTDDLMKQRRTLKRVSIYLQVLLWFYDVGLLPEMQELEEGPLPISLSLKIPYPVDKVTAFYKEKRNTIRKNRGNGKENEEELFIDELIARECPALKIQWEKESGDAKSNGFYPPPSLQSLLRSFLTDCYQVNLNEIESKHQITIYLLMDLAMLLQGSYPGVDQLIKYPSAFKLSPSLIKLTQAFWLLDHEDYQGFLDMMTGQLVSDCDVKEWHHKLVLRTLVKNNQHKLALIYLRIRKPPVLSAEDQSTVISLSVEHGLVQSAFHHRPSSHYAQLLTCFFQACKTYDKLTHVLHLALDPEEEEIFIKFLEADTSENMKLLYYLQRCRYTEIASKHSFGQCKSNVSKSIQSASMAMLSAYKSTLPAIAKHFTIDMAKTSIDVDLESRYPRPLSHFKCITAQQNIYKTVIKKAKETHLKRDKCQIPFITAPCESLKTNENNTSLNCVLFPMLIRRNSNKRTLDQIYDDEENRTMVQDETKRRKLDDGMPVTNISNNKEIESNSAFETPLVKRKQNVFDRQNISLETPHSILKIRQLIQNTSSPNISVAHLTESTEYSLSEKEKRVGRQIRFNIGQSNKGSVHDDISNVEEENINEADVSHGSDDVFVSPNNSDKLYFESTFLSDSSYGGKSDYCPRPRPSLRSSLETTERSLNSSNSRNLMPTSSTALSNKCANTCTVSQDVDMRSLLSSTPPTPRARNSLLSVSSYSTTMLSSDSSFNISTSMKDTNKKDPHALSSNLSVKSDNNYECTISVSSTPLPRTFTDKKLDNKTKTMKVEETEGSTEENSQNTCRSKDRAEIEGSYLQFVPDNTLMTDENEQHVKDTEFASKFEEDLLHSKEKAIEDDEEHNYKSLSTSIENNAILSTSLVESPLKVNHGTYNKLQKSVDSLDNFEVTDDDSSSDLCNVVSKSRRSNNKIKSYDTNVESVHAENIYDAFNITDDESNSSTDVIVKDGSELPDDALALIKEKRNQKDLNTEDSKTAAKVHHSIRLVENVERVNKKSVVRTVDQNDDAKEVSKDERLKDTTVHLFNEDKNSVMSKNNLSKDDTKPYHKMPVRTSRSQRASSVTSDTITSFSKDLLVQTVGEHVRKTRRANSVAKDMCLVDTKTDAANSTELSNPDDSSNKWSLRKTRKSSVASDVSFNETDNEKSEELKTKVLRRSTRLTSLVQKETSINQDTLASNPSVTNKKDNKDEVIKQKSLSTKKKLNATKKVEKLAEVDLPKSLPTSKGRTEETTEARSSSVRKRSCSVPKEIVTERSVMGRRRSSMSMENIAEDNVYSQVESRKRRNSATQKITEELISSPAANTRSRRLSIQSIPEELEEILSVPAQDRSVAEEKEASLNIRRTRRAASVDLPQLEVKRRTRNLRSRSIVEDAIIEESGEAENHVNSKSRNYEKVPTRRKRATSVTDSKELEKETSKEMSKEKSKKGKTKSNVNNESHDQFSFSLPENMNSPLNQAAIDQVPNYVFSPPQTKSNHQPITRSKLRRQINVSLPVSSNEEQCLVTQEGLQTNKFANYTRISLRMPCIRTKFILSKTSKNDAK